MSPKLSSENTLCQERRSHLRLFISLMDGPGRLATETRPSAGWERVRGREVKRFTSDGPASPEGGGRARGRKRKGFRRGGPAPPGGGGRPHKLFRSDGPAPPQGGGKPRPYYTRASQADSLYSRDTPRGRPGMEALLQSAFRSRL